jgi:hypothetical protein
VACLSIEVPISTNLQFIFVPYKLKIFPNIRDNMLKRYVVSVPSAFLPSKAKSGIDPSLYDPFAAPLLRVESRRFANSAHYLVTLCGDIFGDSVEFSGVKLTNEFIFDMVSFINELLND